MSTPTGARHYLRALFKPARSAPSKPRATKFFLPCDYCGEIPYDETKDRAIPVTATPHGLLCPGCDPDDETQRIRRPVTRRPYRHRQNRLIWSKRPTRR